MLTKPLPKTARNIMFVLGLSMITLAGAIEQVERLDQANLVATTAECPDAISVKVITALLRH